MKARHSKWRLFSRMMGATNRDTRLILLEAWLLSFGRPDLNDGQLISLAYWGVVR